MKLLVRMNLCLKLAYSNMSIKLKNTIIWILLLALLLFYTSLMFCTGELTNQLRKQLDRALRGKCSDVGFVGIKYSNDYDIDEVILDILAENEGINAYGAWGIYYSEEEQFQQYKSIQQNNVISEEVPFGVETIVMQASVWEMFDNKLLEGYSPPDDLGDDKILVYFGYEYRDKVEVGTVIQKSHEIEYVVAGVLKKGSLIPDEYLSQLSDYSMQSAYNLDFEILEVGNNRVGMPLYFSTREGYSYEQMRDEIKESLLDYDVEPIIGSVESVIESAEYRARKARIIFTQLLVVSVISFSIIYVCQLFIEIRSRRYDQGVLYANGVSSLQWSLSLLMEGVIKLICAYIIAIPCSLLCAQKLLAYSYSTRQMVNSIIYLESSWKTLILGLLLIGISTIVATNITSKASITELLEGGRK